MTLLSVIIFVLIFSFLIIIHELGHFWAARAAGVRVDEFGLGLPPRIWGRKKGDTIYSLNVIPFGGFVRLKGEAEEATGSDSMSRVGYGWRLLIITGGVLMNLLAAYVVLCIGMWLGMPPLASDPAALGIAEERISAKVFVVEVTPGLPAETAGLKPGDLISAVDGISVSRVSELVEAIGNKTSVSLALTRSGEAVSLIVPTALVEGSRVIGIAADRVAERVSYPAYLVPVAAASDFYQIVVQIGQAIGQFVGRLFTTASLSPEVSGPIGIARITAQAVEIGFLSVLQLVVLLSINLGLINLFPFPALDGGRLVFLLGEMAFRGRKIPAVVENVIHNLGFALLLALIVVVTYRDVLKLFR